MRVVLQRVASASVSVDDRPIATIGRGLLLFVGFGRGDGDIDLERVAARVLGLRVFSDGDDRLMHSVIDVGGAVLVVPQFTLYARTDRGRRPDFGEAMAPDQARVKFDALVDALAKQANGRVEVRSGEFGAAMAVSLVNDGPLTLVLHW